MHFVLGLNSLTPKSNCMVSGIGPLKDEIFQSLLKVWGVDLANWKQNKDGARADSSPSSSASPAPLAASSSVAGPSNGDKDRDVF